jgi:hypothetical protein
MDDGAGMTQINVASAKRDDAQRAWMMFLGSP